MYKRTRTKKENRREISASMREGGNVHAFSKKNFESQDRAKIDARVTRKGKNDDKISQNGKKFRLNPTGQTFHRP